MQYTPEEIAAAHDRNENFHGQCANFEKIKLYQQLRDELLDLMQTCNNVDLVDGFDPNPEERHAMLWMDLSPAAILNKAAAEKLADIMQKSDGMVLSAVKGHVRISFDVNDVWETEE